MKGIENIRKRLGEIEGVANAGSIPSTDANGNRTWIRGRGCGILFMREILRWRRDGGELAGDLLEQTQLWARAEVDGDIFGGIARANRQEARRILGI
jgi:hypothetical protein